MNVVARETKLTLATPHWDALTQEMIPPLALLVRLIEDQGSIVVHVTSARHGEGTSTVARELAAVAARSRWCKVALLESHRPDSDTAMLADPSAAALLETFGANGTIQLHRVRVGDVEMAAGTLSSTFGVTPKVESVRSLYNRLRADYTLVIVDCPPVADAGDTAAFAATADGTILVVEAERTRIAEIKRARDKLDQWGATILGVVLNKRRQRVPRFLQRLM